MGNNLPHDAYDDDNQNGPEPKRKTSASVDEIRSLYSALQELVPSQTRPSSTTAYGSIPEETGTSRSGGERVVNDTAVCDAVSRGSNLNPVLLKRHRCSSPVPVRSQPKIVQRNRSNSCFAISASCNAFAAPPTENLVPVYNPRGSGSSKKSQRINEELSNLIDSFGKKKTSLKQNEKNCIKTDLPEVEEFSTKRRHSGGDILEQHQERLKDPKMTRNRRRSIGGSLLLNAIKTSNSNRQDSLTNAMSIIARKEGLQEKNRSSREDSETGSDVVEESLDEVDGKPQQDQRNPKENTLMSLIDDPQKLDGSFSAGSEVKPEAKVGAEMHNLLEALQELVVSGEGTPAQLTPSESSQSSRRTSWVEKPSPKRRESLDELEFFFKNKLDEISEKENEETVSTKQIKTNTETTKASKNRNKESLNSKESDKNRFRRSSSAEQCRVAPSTLMSSNLKSNSIHRSQSTVEFLNPSHVAKTRSLGTRRASVQIEMNRNVKQGRSNSSFGITSHLETLSIKQKKATRLNASSNRSRRRKSDIPIIRHEHVVLDSPTADEAKKRALWKEDQELFAKQVNQRLQDWLERATALSLSNAGKQDTEDDSTSQVSVETNPDSPKEEDVKTKRAKFAMKKAFKGRIKRSKSLHNVLDHEDVQVEKPKPKSPLIKRSKENFRKLGRLRIPGSKSVLNVAEIKSALDKIETKSTESDESCSSSTNTRRSTIWYDEEIDSPERIPIDISGTNVSMEKLSQRRRSCPTPKNTYVNSTAPLDSKRVSRLPVDLPLFYHPGMNTSNLRVQKKIEKCRQNSSEKENNIPRDCKGLFLIKKEIKNELFYKEPKVANQVYSSPSSSSTNLNSSDTNSPSLPSTDDGRRVMLENYGVSKLSPSSDFDNFDDFRDRAKSTESEDSGCPNTSDYS